MHFKLNFNNKNEKTIAKAIKTLSVTTKNSAPINTVFSGVLSGTFGLTKSVSGQTTGVDTLVLSNDNSSTYNGTITVNYGVLKVSNEKSLDSK